MKQGFSRLTQVRRARRATDATSTGKLLPARSARRSHRHRRYRLGPGQRRPGAAHDTRPRSLLRRHGARQERAEHDDDELRSPWPSSACCGCCSATRSPSARGPVDRRFDGSASRPSRVEHGQRPIPDLAFVVFQLMFAIITPALISGAIADRAKFGGWARSSCSGSPSSTSRSPTGSSTSATTAGWMPTQAGRASRLRRWYGRPRQRRCRRPGARAGPRQAPRLERDPMRPHNLPLVTARRRPAVVRLVRLQRRLRARRQRPRRHGVRQHAGRHRRRHDRLADRRAVRAVGHQPRCRLRRGRRSGRDHAGLWRGVAARRVALGVLAGAVCALAVGLK